ncbi:hypothetical protein L1987_49417 [Smallanthus sonchifolius]|uniref:Uncharacterized protein n=1 Tax=Smallanthus sonchifolius TaxID=185202 RepID=A0ACB9FUG6_9ASTR|nr:hypothetical protein L1987_49417 [Smallanthus sonchifolius]
MGPTTHKENHFTDYEINLSPLLIHCIWFFIISCSKFLQINEHPAKSQQGLLESSKTTAQSKEARLAWI